MSRAANAAAAMAETEHDARMKAVATGMAHHAYANLAAGPLGLARTRENLDALACVAAGILSALDDDEPALWAFFLERLTHQRHAAERVAGRA